MAPRSLISSVFRLHGVGSRLRAAVRIGVSNPGAFSPLSVRRNGSVRRVIVVNTRYPPSAAAVRPLAVSAARCSFASRFCTTWKAPFQRSIPTHSRPRRSAATGVVAQPQNGSRTTSPGLEEARIIRSYSASGFCVGYPVRSFLGICPPPPMSVHQSSGTLPLPNSSGSPQTGVGRLRRDRRVGEGCWQRGRPRN